MLFRFPKLGRTTSILLGLLVVLAIGVAVFDWNWFRHPLERYLIHRSHREVRIGEMHVDLGFSLEPTVRMRDVYIENAPWADKRPFVIAGEASLTFSLKSVWEGRPVISRLVLIDAELDMERQVDGLRNWRLRNPEDRGPGQVTVLRLEPHRTKIRFVRRDIDLDISAAASPSQSGTEDPKPDASNPTRIDFKGEFGGTELSGELLTSALLTLLETGESFSMRGYASAGKSRLDFDGTVADLLNPSAIDAKVRLAGPSLSNLHPFFRALLPASRPFEFESRVRQTQGDISFAEVRGKIGNTDLVGEFSVDRSKERPMLRAAVRSKSADLSDFGSRVVTGHSLDKVTDKEEAAREKPDSRAMKPRRIFSERPLDFDRLDAFDAQVGVDLGKLKAAAWPQLESLKVTANLQNGVLTLKPIDLGLAGGHLVGSLTVDGRRLPAFAQAKIDASGVRLENLLAGRLLAGLAAGPIAARFDLTGKGASVAAMLGTVSGSVKIVMEEGGRISRKLSAAVELDAGKFLSVLISGDTVIAINSAAIDFDFEDGVGKSHTIRLDTEQARIDGAGLLNLRDETMDLLLTPHPKKPAILALNSSIRVNGPLVKPKFEIVSKAVTGNP
jgi:AsmA family protein